MSESIFDHAIYQEIVYQAYYGRPGEVDKLCSTAFEAGDITLDDLVEIVERVGEHFMDAEKLVGDLTQ